MRLYCFDGPLKGISVEVGGDFIRRCQSYIHVERPQPTWLALDAHLDPLSKPKQTRYDHAWRYNSFTGAVWGARTPDSDGRWPDGVYIRRFEGRDRTGRRRAHHQWPVLVDAATISTRLGL